MRSKSNSAARGFCCVRLRRAPGLIAGGAVRAILELAGVKDVLAKSLGAANAANVAKATFKAISQLSSREEVYARRGIPMPQAAQVAAPVAENN